MKPQTPEVSIIVPEGEVFSDIRVCLQMKSHATRVRDIHFGLLFCDPRYRFQSSSYVYYSWNFSSQHNISVSVFTCHQYIHKRSNYQYKHLTIRLQPTGSQRVGHNWSDSTHAWSTTGEGNGNPLQYYCLQNPVDKGAWWAVVHRVAQSQTRMKWLSSSSSMVYYMGFTGGNPWFGKIPGEGNRYPLKYSCREIPWTEEPGGLQLIGLHRVVSCSWLRSATIVPECF